jgi:hypothetical protein
MSIRVRRALSSSGLALLLSTLVGGANLGCHPGPAEAPVARTSHGTAAKFVAGFSEEMKDPRAVSGYVAALRHAAENPDDPAALAVTIASLDAMVYGAVEWGAAYRTRESFQAVAVGLRESFAALDGSSAKAAPFMRSLLARGLQSLATFTGEQGGAAVWRSKRGCASSATVVGPLDVAPLTALEEPPAIPTEAPLPASFEAPNRFVAAAITQVEAQGCGLDSSGSSDKPGLREIVLHVDNPKDQRLSFMLSGGSVWQLSVGGQKLAERKVDADWSGGSAFAHAEVTSGVARVVLRLADRTGSFELSVLDEEGKPLGARGVRDGESATATVSAPGVLDLRTQSTKEDDLVASAAALLAVGDARRAEHLLEAGLLAQREDRHPAYHLLFVRAMERASDMAEWARIERTKASIDAVRKAEPESWEAKIASANMSQRRKGYSDGTFEALVELGIKQPSSDLSALDLMELNLALSLARQAGMNDVAERIYEAMAAAAPGAPMVASIDQQLHVRSGREAISFACEGGLSRASLACADAKLAVGDKRGALDEFDRLRKLLGSPHAYKANEVRVLQELGKDEDAIKLYLSLPRWQRSLSSVLPAFARMKDREEGRRLAERELIAERNREFMLQSVDLAFGKASEDARRFEERGKAIIEADKKKQALPGAATAVLEHVEHYGMDEDGLMKVVLYDVRRIAGTTDVDRTMSVDQPSVDGRGFMRPLRRRVHKVDGRVLEAEVAGGGLSQLEKGDYVEHYLEGWFQPSELGELTIDTPDLLPERTSVARAEVVMRLPSWFQPTMWTHPLLGKGTEETKGAYRFLRFGLENRDARRMEDGLPWLERGVRISLGTQTWEKVGRNVGENMRGLVDRDPFVSRFAEEALQGEESTDEAAVVRRVVEHVGKKVKIASGGAEFGDFAGFSGGGGRGMSMRPIVEEGVGSRTFVLLTTLRDLGIDVDVAVSETEPFSAAPNFPPHPGRFQKPLVVAKLESGDLWIDADVSGPPLPPGRVSPELRGRMAILGSGEIVPVPVQTETDTDTVDLDLQLDAAGTAKGSVTLTLRSRSAQSLVESFNYVVGADRTNMLRSVVGGWLPWASVDDVKLASTESSWEVRIEATVTIPGYGSIDSRDGKTWVLPGYDPARSGTLTSIWGTKTERESGLNIDAPIQYRLTRKVKLPAGAKIEKSAAPLASSTTFIQAKRTLTSDGGVLTEVFDMNVSTGTIDQAAYRTFLGEVRAIDSGFLAGTRVRVRE